MMCEQLTYTNDGLYVLKTLHICNYLSVIFSDKTKLGKVVASLWFFKASYN
jgi:hypothetical protein